MPHSEAGDKKHRFARLILLVRGLAHLATCISPGHELQDKSFLRDTPRISEDSVRRREKSFQFHIPRPGKDAKRGGARIRRAPPTRTDSPKKCARVRTRDIAPARSSWTSEKAREHLGPSGFPSRAARDLYQKSRASEIARRARRKKGADARFHPTGGIDAPAPFDPGSQPLPGNLIGIAI